MMSGWTLQSVVDSLKCSSHQLQNDHRLANDAKPWLEQCAHSVLCLKRVAPLHVKIMSMVFGVESLKKNGMQPVIDSSHLSVFAQSLNANFASYKSASSSS
jgi:hypothetical protein